MRGRVVDPVDSEDVRQDCTSSYTVAVRYSIYAGICEGEDSRR